MEPRIAREIEVIVRVATRDRSGFYPDASPEDLAEYLKNPNSLVTGKNTGIFIVGASEYD